MDKGTIRSSIVLVIAGFISPQSGWTEQMSVSEILDRYEATQQAQRIRIERTEEVFVQSDSALDHEEWEKWITEYRTDGVHMDYVSRRYQSKYETGITATAENEGLETRNIWDGSTWFNYYKYRGALAITEKEIEKMRYLSLTYGPSRLEGVFFGDLKPVSEILREASDVKLGSQKETVNDVACWLIEAKTAYGNYAIWFDPEHGYNIARAQVLKQDNNILGVNPLNKAPNPIPPHLLRFVSTPPLPRKSKYSFSLSTVRFGQFGSFWFPMEVDYEFEFTYENGRVGTRKSHIKRTQINLNPDFKSIKAFIPDIPNGTRVTNMDLPNTGAKYEWQDGRVIPYVDHLILSEIDKEIDEFKTRSGIDESDEEEDSGLSKDTEIVSLPEKSGEKQALDVTRKRTPNCLLLPIILIVILALGCAVVVLLRRKRQSNGQI